MLYVLCTVLGLCFFIAPLWAYRRGLRDGLDINKGREIQPIQPIREIKEQISVAEVSKVQKEMEKAFEEGIRNIMSFDVKG